MVFRVQRKTIFPAERRFLSYVSEEYFCYKTLEGYKEANTATERKYLAKLIKMHANSETFETLEGKIIFS